MSMTKSSETPVPGVSASSSDYKIFHKLTSKWTMFARDRDIKVAPSKFEQTLETVRHLTP